MENVETTIEHERRPKSDPPFEIMDVNTDDGTVTVKVKKGILGSMANQLKKTNNRRKAASIIRKLGFELADVGDVLYGTENEDELIVDNDD